MEVFIAKYDSAYNLQWVKQSVGMANIHSPSGNAQAYSISVRNTEICITGHATGKVAFDGLIYDEDAYPRMFVANLHENTIGINEPNNSNSNLSIYPNPTFKIINVIFSKENIKQIQISVKSQLGQVIYSVSDSNTGNEYRKTIDLSKENKGIYFVEIIADGKKSVKKIVLN